ncbi:hypothetical protein N5079_19860 [Planotetraspora sp. A-T 1434]|uniref:hypothetical protein n=1 Tax=Planotetraspora sp. A-T 1434 TaxID=2979219 RepID=UPI0021BEE54D|nr:hypothetical protein [Planotetraspora sp. A-T 1434]MCT9932461.1 hypothetical protein [Planotetraspora sp. A-T 1434]
MKIFGREPAVILHALQAVLAFLVTLPALNSLGLTAEVSGWVMTIAAGLVALLVAVATRPFVVSAATGAVQTILTGLVAFGLPLSEQSTGALVAALNVVLMLLMPLGLTPAADPDPKFVRAQRRAIPRRVL